MAYVVDGQFELSEYNQANPMIDLTSMVTHGVQAGYGWKLNQGRRPKDEIRFGAAAKILWRRGGMNSISTAGLVQASADGVGYLKSLLGSYEMGIGFDAGAQYLYNVSPHTKVMSGLSVTDVPNINFSGRTAMDQPMAVNWGLGVKGGYNQYTYSLGFDIRNIFQSTAFTNKLHFGGEFSMELLSFYLGFNQLFLTYGVAFDLWIMRVSLVSYGEESGYFYDQNSSRRYLFQFDFKLPI